MMEYRNILDINQWSDFRKWLLTPSSWGRNVECPIIKGFSAFENENSVGHPDYVGRTNCTKDPTMNSPDDPNCSHWLYIPLSRMVLMLSPKRTIALGRKNKRKNFRLILRPFSNNILISVNKASRFPASNPKWKPEYLFEFMACTGYF